MGVALVCQVPGKDRPYDNVLVYARHAVLSGMGVVSSADLPRTREHHSEQVAAFESTIEHYVLLLIKLSRYEKFSIEVTYFLQFCKLI